MEKPGTFDLHALAREFPDSADTLLLDRYLSDTSEASTRLFRVYRSTPPHFHEHSDEHLLVLSGRGTFWLEKPENAGEFGPGTLLVFPRGTVHALPEMLETPIVFFALDTPRRRPDDIVFVDAADGTPASFIAQTNSK